MLTDPIADDDRLFADEKGSTDRRTIIWGAFVAGLAIGFVAVYIVVAQPLFEQLKLLQRQTVLLQEDVQKLAGARNQVWEAGTLLSDLASLKSHVGEARATLRDMRRLQNDLVEESHHTAEAMAALRELAQLQMTAVEQQDQTGPAAWALEQWGRVQQKLIDTAATLPAAQSAASELFSLKDQLVSQTDGLDQAHTQANRLLAMQNELTAHGEQSAAALHALDRLLEVNDRLVDQTPQLTGAVENLEILSDFQADLTAQVESLSQMREGLTQILLMESTIGRVVRVLQPLTQIVNIRRLSDQEMREAARAILDQRAVRLGLRAGVPQTLSRTAENDEVAPLSEDTRFAEDLPAPGASQADASSLPLPLTQQTSLK